MCQVAKNWSMRRDGADLHSDVTVSLSQALLGGTIRVPGINDEIVFNVSQHRCSVHCRALIGSHRDATISLSQALLGGTIRVPGINDEIVFTVSHFAMVHYTHTPV